MTAQQVAHEIDGSGVEVPQPDLRDAQYRNAPQQQDTGRSAEFQFTAEQIEKARREEREKVQKEKKRLKEQQDALKAELDELNAWKAAREAEREQQEKALAKRQKEEEESELSAKELIAKRDREWTEQQAAYEARFQELQKEREQEKQLLQYERQYMEVQNYLQKRLAEEQVNETIAPQLARYVRGASVEEVDAAIEEAQRATQEIMEEVNQSLAGRSRATGVSLSTGPSNLPSDMGGLVTQDAEPAVPKDYADFAKNRHLYIKAAQGQGLFG